jgi:hypothetical protein
MYWTKICCATVAALVSVGVYGHDCSGGTGGGMDATGNDCGLAVESQPLPVASSKMTGTQEPLITPISPVKTSKVTTIKGATREAVTINDKRDRFAQERYSPTEPIKTSKVVNVESPVACSGGASGGMDATGNECNGIEPVTLGTALASASKRPAP